MLVKIACYLLNFYIQDITKPAVYYIFYIQGIKILNIKKKIGRKKNVRSGIRTHAHMSETECIMHHKHDINFLTKFTLFYVYLPYDKI